MPFCQIHLQAQKPLPEILRTEPKTPGDHLRRRRFVLGHTQAHAAEAIGVGLTAVWRMEGEGTQPHPRTLPAFERYLGYPLAPASAELGDRIRAWRKKLGISRKEAGRRLGVTGRTLARIEDDEEATLGVRVRIAAALDASMG